MLPFEFSKFTFYMNRAHLFKNKFKVSEVLLKSFINNTTAYNSSPYALEYFAHVVLEVTSWCPPLPIFTITPFSIRLKKSSCPSLLPLVFYKCDTSDFGPFDVT